MNGIPSGFPHCLLSSAEWVENKNRLAIYPNPATNLVHLASDKPIRRIELYDVTGALLYESGFSAHEGELDISFLPQGIYILKVNGENVNRIVKCGD